jgi:uncharacterized Zn finger protein
MKITCPKCSSSEGVREILYGLPSEEPDPAIYIVGGCLVERNQPTHRCITCGWERIKNRFIYDEEDMAGITIIKAADIEGS